MIEKKTLVIGASLKQERYSNRAIRMLREHNVPTEAIGLREGEVAGVKIKKPDTAVSGIHTVTIYLSQKNQKPYEEYLAALQPKRVVFNPGAENPTFMKRMMDAGADAFEACTLVMLSTGQF